MFPTLDQILSDLSAEIVVSIVTPFVSMTYDAITRRIGSHPNARRGGSRSIPLRLYGAYLVICVLLGSFALAFHAGSIWLAAAYVRQPGVGSLLVCLTSYTIVSSAIVWLAMRMLEGYLCDTLRVMNPYGQDRGVWCVALVAKVAILLIGFALALTAITGGLPMMNSILPAMLTLQWLVDTLALALIIFVE
jgi:hypothetical protein